MPCSTITRYKFYIPPRRLRTTGTYINISSYRIQMSGWLFRAEKLKYNQ